MCALRSIKVQSTASTASRNDDNDDDDDDDDDDFVLTAAPTNPSDVRAATASVRSSIQTIAASPPATAEERKHRNTGSTFNFAGSVPAAAADSAAAAAALPASKPAPEPFVAQWLDLTHVDLIHRQGLRAPPVVFQALRDPDDAVRSVCRLTREVMLVVNCVWPSMCVLFCHLLVKFADARVFSNTVTSTT